VLCEQPHDSRAPPDINLERIQGLLLIDEPISELLRRVLWKKQGPELARVTPCLAQIFFDFRSMGRAFWEVKLENCTAVGFEAINPLVLSRKCLEPWELSSQQVFAEFLEALGITKD
jgi:hypothetical protein